MNQGQYDVIETMLSDEYTRGYTEGTRHGMEISKDYEQGLNDAWECARKIIEMGEYTRKWEVFTKCGDGEYPFEKYSASEAIAKIKEYEEKQKQADDEIKVGDEFKSNNSDRNCVIARINVDEVTIMWSDGSLGIRAIDYISENFKKTGRHFSQMAEVLKQMTEEPTAKHSDRAVADRLCMACKYGDLCVDAEVCQDCFFDRTKPNFEEAE